MSGFNFQEILHFLSEDLFFTTANSLDHNFIWILTVCNVACLGVYHIKMVNLRECLDYLKQLSEYDLEIAQSHTA